MLWFVPQNRSPKVGSGGFNLFAICDTLFYVVLGCFFLFQVDWIFWLLSGCQVVHDGEVVLDVFGCFQFGFILLWVVEVESVVQVVRFALSVAKSVSGRVSSLQVQLHTGSTCTPPRVARLCQVREASLASLRKFYISTLPQLCRSLDSSTSPYSYPVTHLPGELVSASCVPIPSIDLIL